MSPRLIAASMARLLRPVSRCAVITEINGSADRSRARSRKWRSITLAQAGIEALDSDGRGRGPLLDVAGIDRGPEAAFAATGELVRGGVETQGCAARSGGW
jgi:hypothetical protein